MLLSIIVAAVALAGLIRLLTRDRRPESVSELWLRELYRDRRDR